jgi:hypothetical protein
MLDDTFTTLALAVAVLASFAGVFLDVLRHRRETYERRRQLDLDSKRFGLDVSRQDINNLGQYSDIVLRMNAGIRTELDAITKSYDSLIRKYDADQEKRNIEKEAVGSVLDEICVILDKRNGESGCKVALRNIKRLRRTYNI